MAARDVQARPVLPGREAPVAPTAQHVATWIYAVTGGDAWWRCEAPAAAVGGKTIGIPSRLLKRAVSQPNSSTPLPWRIELTTDDGETHGFSTMKAWKDFTRTRPLFMPLTVRSVFPTVEGTVIWQRPDIARAALALSMQDQGVRTVAETDDNYFANTNQNLFLRHNRFSDDDRVAHAKSFALMDACVFSTARLRDMYAKEIRARLGKKALPEMHVCRNHVPRDQWPQRVERDGPVRVGFMGSPSHVWDVNLAYGAFHLANADGAETVMIGYNPANPDPEENRVIDPGIEWRSEKSRSFMEKWAAVIDRHIPWVEPSEYHRAALPLDIGLCPLRSDSFTLGKSDAKALEYTISGAAVVCQNNPVYNTAGWKHGVNCLMASTSEEMGRATLKLIREPKLRYELVSAAQQMVAEERNEDAIRLEWGAVL